MCNITCKVSGESSPITTTNFCGGKQHNKLCGALCSDTRLEIMVDTDTTLPPYFAEEWFPRAWMILLVSLEIKFIGEKFNDENSSFVNAFIGRLFEVFYDKTNIECLLISGLGNYKDRILFITTLKRILDMCPQLQTINLENNGFCFTELFGARNVIEGFLNKMPPTVVTMILDGNPLNLEKLDVCSVSEAFRHLKNLRELSWKNTTISKVFCSALVLYFFTKHITIESVCLLTRQTLMVNVGNCEGVKKYVEAYRLVNFEPCPSFDVCESCTYVRFSASKLLKL
jgi:hypothetical protein